MKMNNTFNLPLHYCDHDGVHDDDGAFFQCFEDTSMDAAAAHAINCHDPMKEALEKIIGLADNKGGIMIRVAKQALEAKE